MHFCSIPAHFNRPNNSFGPFQALVSSYGVIFAHWTHQLMFVFIIFHFMDGCRFLPAAKMSLSGVNHLLNSCRWIVYRHQGASHRRATPLNPLRPPGCLPAQRGWRKHFCGEEKLHDAFVCVPAREGGSCLHNHTLPSLWWQFAPPPPPPPPLTASPSLLHLFLSGSPGWSAQ